MLRKTVSGTMVTLLLMGVLTLAFNIQPAKGEPTTIIVPDDYPTIQKAINAASPGDIIYVYGPNYYQESVIVNKSVSLIGKLGPGLVSFDVVANNVYMKGFNFSSGGWWPYGSCIVLHGVSGCNISNVIVSEVDEGDGIVLTNASNNVIANSWVRGFIEHGCIVFERSSNNTIFGNTIEARWAGSSIYLVNSSDNKFFHNQFSSSLYEARQVEVIGSSINVWDNGYPYDGNGGNYWSNYTGVDLFNGRCQNITGSDGIGDVPYIIDANNKDNYPLMNPWPPAPSSPGYYETSEYLIGSVAVSVLFLESNGTIDTDTENWTSTEKSQVVSKIQYALTWWSQQNPSANVSFVLTNCSVPTSYEPINRPRWPDEYLWMGEAMTYLGYSPRLGTDPREEYCWQQGSYVNSLRDSSGTDWAFVIFVVDSSNDADGKFPDGYFAYAYFGGPVIVMTYDNGGWGIDRMDCVTAHEIGHIFYATDEYPPNISQYSGYLNVESITGSGCLMDKSTWFLSSGTWGQVGWRDSDSDGLQDIVDTFPDTILNSYSPDPTNKPTLTYNGTVTEIPYHNNNPHGTGRDVTINTITNVEFRVDGGAWINATPDDGAFDEFKESFSFTTPPLSMGSHTIEARGTNSVGNVEITYASDIVTIEKRHDVGVKSVVPFKTVVGQGYSLNINVTVANQGNYTETFNATVYANTTIIATLLTNITLTSGNSITLTFSWNTAGFAKGNYTIWAYAWPVPGETHTADNTFTDGWVIVSIVGDVTGPDGWPDGKVDMIYDIRTVAKLFGVAPPDPRYIANYDINGDGVIDMLYDIRTVAKQFGKTDP